jgi:serine acetyltransferase
VVVRDVPDYAVVGGVPAKILRIETPESSWTRNTIAARKPPASPDKAGDD